MKTWPGRILLLFLLGAPVLAFPANAQKPAPQQTVIVTVVNALPNPARPVSHADVSLWSSQDVQYVRRPTDSRGQAALEISPDVARSGDLRIEVTHASELVIYLPAGGQLDESSVLPATIKVSLLPKGSLALLEPGEIEAMLRGKLREVKNLQKQVTMLKFQTADEQGQQPDLDASIATWARENGFKPEQVDLQVRQWAEGIRKQSGQATLRQRALAELALKHYAAAIQLWSQTCDADEQVVDKEDMQEQARQARIKSMQEQLKAEQQADEASLDEQRSALRQYLTDRGQEADTEMLNGQYHEATLTYEKAEAKAQAEYKKHPDDKGYHEILLDAEVAKAMIMTAEARNAPASESLALITQSADSAEAVAREYSKLGDRKKAAAVQMVEGLILSTAGHHAVGEQAKQLLSLAQSALRNGLGYISKTDDPTGWSLFQRLLGEDLVSLAMNEDASGKAMALFDQAVRAYGAALEVYTKADAPRDWAETQFDLGVLYTKEGDLSSSENAKAFLDKATQALQSALEVYTETDTPKEWASTQAALGLAIYAMSTHSSGDTAAALLDQAAQALRSSLEVDTKADQPKQWADMQVFLGDLLKTEASYATGTKALALLDQAARAYQGALEVFAKADRPEDWAKTQVDLGDTLRHENERATGDKAMAMLDQAARAYRSALEVYTKADLPKEWAETQSSLGIVLALEAGSTGGDKALPLFDQAAAALRNALEVYSKADEPKIWADIQVLLADVLTGEGGRTSGDNATKLFQQAEEAFQNALEVYTRTDHPSDWAHVESNLMGLFHDSTFQFSEALKAAKDIDEFEPSVDNGMNLIEAELTGAQFGDCRQLATKLDDASLAQKKDYVPVRDVIALACSWGAGDKAAALAEDREFLAKVRNGLPLKAGSWSFKGDLHFLSESLVFAAGRDSWIALFTSVQNGDSAGVTGALQELEPVLQ